MDDLEVSSYAVIEVATGLVVNVVMWDGGEDWQPEDGFSAVQSAEAQIGWTYADGKFSAPPAPEPTPDEILAANTQQRDSLLATASQAMTPLLLSLQLGDATDEETASAKAWQAYSRALKAVDLTASDPAWPTIPA